MTTLLSRLRAAKFALAAPLRFGDEGQICAMRVVEEIFSLHIAPETLRSLNPCRSRWEVFNQGLSDLCWDWDEPVPLTTIQEINGQKDVEWVLGRLIDSNWLQG